MRTSEWVTIGYFLYLMASAALLGTPFQRFRHAALLEIAAFLSIVVSRTLVGGELAVVARDWLPGAYLMLGYWATGLMYRGPNLALERVLAGIDRALPLGTVSARLPRVATEALELCYLVCYPLVPAGLALLYATGRRAEADAYWSVVLAATFAAYGVLPWAGSRPPRWLETPAAVPAVSATAAPAASRVSARESTWGYASPIFFRRVNWRVLGGASIQVNTFPSGHAAAATAVALFVLPLGAWGAAFAVIAAGIVVGAALGRYHYALDVVAGVAVAFVMFLLLRL